MKAYFFDIDGTLVSFKSHLIPQSAIDALHGIKEQGHLVIIATGRPKSIINNLNQLDELGLVDGYITMNGGYTYVGDKVLTSNPIPHEDLQDIISYTRQLGVTNVYMFENEEKYLVRESEQYKYIFYDMLNIAHIPCSEETIEEVLANRTLFQITTFVNKEQEAVLSQKMKGSAFTRWHPYFLDIIGKGNTKQKGIEAICEYFHIKKEDTFAFGDGGNDISMIQYAGTGIAMGNATDDVKVAADYVTDSVDDNGIFNALKNLNQI